MLCIFFQETHTLIINAFSLKSVKYCEDQRSHSIFTEPLLCGECSAVAGDNMSEGLRDLVLIPPPHNVGNFWQSFLI